MNSPFPRRQKALPWPRIAVISRFHQELRRASDETYSGPPNLSQPAIILGFNKVLERVRCSKDLSWPKFVWAWPDFGYDQNCLGSALFLARRRQYLLWRA